VSSAPFRDRGRAALGLVLSLRELPAPHRIARDLLRQLRARPGRIPRRSRDLPLVAGTPIAYETERRADEIDLYLNAFETPETFRPGGHAFFAERIPWFDTRDDLPRK
jgi:hypothetical protein